MNNPVKFHFTKTIKKIIYIFWSTTEYKTTKDSLAELLILFNLLGKITDDDKLFFKMKTFVELKFSLKNNISFFCLEVCSKKPYASLCSRINKLNSSANLNLIQSVFKIVVVSYRYHFVVV